VIVRVDLPPLAGVVVVASGANDSRVKALLSQAVQVLYGVPAHRVIVLTGG
jgi:stage III sporulation protein AG